MTARTYAYGSKRRLASLKWSGLEPNADHMIIVPAGTPAMVVREVEALCAHDDIFDWKMEGDAQ